MNASGPQPRWHILAAAPHRLPFLTGVFNLVVLLLWWVAHLAQRDGVALRLPAHDGLDAALHGPLTLYALFTPFVLGFLSTVFPRWMGMADLSPRQFLPPALLMTLGSLTLACALWLDRLAILNLALVLLFCGWGTGAVVLASVIRANQRSANEPHWHGLSALAAWLLALAGLAALLAFTLLDWPDGRGWAILLGTHGLTVGIFLTVCHRMIPFFAGNVVDGYVSWRPYWLLASLWPLLLADMALAWFGSPWRVLAAGSLSLLLLLMLWRWTPRRAAPGLLWVLIIGFGWAPVSFALAALAAVGIVPLLAATHALVLGMGCSLMVAMVTRVTQGHSGRPLVMPPLGWLAFAAVQLATLLRLAAVLRWDEPTLLLVASLLLAVGTLPWALRGMSIYLRPRTDGRHG